MDGIDMIPTYDRLRTVTHADVCNFIDMQRNKQRATKAKPPKESNVPHVASRPHGNRPEGIAGICF
jgi:hypothetical protein